MYNPFARNNELNFSYSTMGNAKALLFSMYFKEHCLTCPEYFFSMLESRNLLLRSEAFDCAEILRIIQDDDDLLDLYLHLLRNEKHAKVVASMCLSYPLWKDLNIYVYVDEKTLAYVLSFQKEGARSSNVELEIAYTRSSGRSSGRSSKQAISIERNKTENAQVEKKIGLWTPFKQKLST